MKTTEKSEAVTSPTQKPVEAWRDEKRIESWLFAAAAAGRRWAIGQEITEAEFDQAIAATRSIRIGYHLKG